MAAACERFPHRTIGEGAGDLWLVRLEGAPRALHLTHQPNLDALAVDDRISTGRVDEAEDPLLDLCQRLADATHDWWNHRSPPLVYRTRSMPSTRSIAFTAATELTPVVARPLREARTLLSTLVLRHGFEIPTHWI